MLRVPNDAVNIQFSKLTQADGSALFNKGLTSVVAAVYGPADCRSKRESPDKMVIDVTYRCKAGMSRCEDKTVEDLIRKTFEATLVTLLHPRTCTSIILQEIQDDGCLLSASVNAACLALLDAALPMQYVVAAVDCAIDSDGQIILNPSKKAEKSGKGRVTVVVDNVRGDLVACVSEGQVSDDLLTSCIALCKEEAQKLFTTFRQAVETKVKQVVH